MPDTKFRRLKNNYDILLSLYQFGNSKPKIWVLEKQKNNNSAIVIASSLHSDLKTKKKTSLVNDYNILTV